MAHPKSKISKMRKRKRRTHYKAEVPNLTTCKTTGEKHMPHRAYWVDDTLYYRGKPMIEIEEELED